MDEHTPVGFASVAPLSSLLLSPHVQRHCGGWKNDMCSPLCGQSNASMASFGRTKFRGWSVNVYYAYECKNRDIEPISLTIRVLSRL